MTLAYSENTVIGTMVTIEMVKSDILTHLLSVVQPISVVSTIAVL